MSIHPLPMPPTLDLSDPASLRFWHEEPTPFRGNEMAAFWSRMPPLTAPQFLAVRLQRHPLLVSLWTTTLIYERWQQRAAGVMDSLPLDIYEGIFRRTHSALVFRLDPSRVRRPNAIAAGNPLRPLLAWAAPDGFLEAGFVMAGLPEPMPYAARERAVKDALMNGARAGFVLNLHRRFVPPMVYWPSAAWCRGNGINEPRLKASALAHGQVAIEGALYRSLVYAARPGVERMRSEADVIAEKRAGHAFRKGQTLSATPDLEVTLRTGERYWVEALSTDYKGDDVRAKFADLQVPVDFVATSRTLARRVDRCVPTIACHHF